MSQSVESEIEQFVRIYGEKYRRFFTDALTWLNDREPEWGLERKTSRKQFIKAIVESAVIE